MKSLPWFKPAVLLALAATVSSGAQRPVPVALPPWAFLDASAEVGETAPLSVFRAAVEGDVDKDGDLDVVVPQAFTAAGVDGTPARGVLWINEEGRFVEQTSALLPQFVTPEVRWWVTVHDFAGPGGPSDGWPDIFAPGGGGGPSRFFMNQGRDAGGTFLGFVEDPSRIVGSPLSAATHSYHSHKADFDGDGLMDLLVYQYKPNLGSGFGQTRILMNIDGSLTDETASRLPARGEPTIFGHAMDVNGDMMPDISMLKLKNGLVPGNYTGVPTIRVLINDGMDFFPSNLEQVMPERLSPGSGFGTYALEIMDFNGDMREDIYVINWGMSGNMARDGVLLNVGSGNQLFTQVAYPTFPTSGVDNDGDHPVAADLNGDDKMDLVVAQFSSRPFFLINESEDGVLRLREATPPEVPSAQGFRCKIFDANGDGKKDVWLALRNRNYLLDNSVAEMEPNDRLGSENRTLTLPALRAGYSDAGDTDVYRLPHRALIEGTRVWLKPTFEGDLRLNLLDGQGTVVATSAAPGNGVPEFMDVPPGMGEAYLGVERQQADRGGFYRLEILRAGALNRPLRKAAPYPVVRRARRP